jgi:hypothetical protein
MRGFWSTVLALVLPFPEREPYARESPVDLPFWSMVLGYAELLGAFGWMVGDLQSFFQRQTALHTEIFLANPRMHDNFDGALAFMWSGILVVLLWFLRPTTWLALSVVAVGGFRLIVFFTSREVSGELFAAIVLSIRKLIRRASDPARQLARYGPPDRPDRFRDDPATPGLRQLITARQHPEWVDGATLEIGDTFYEILGGVPEQLEGELFLSWVYRLREQPGNHIIRRLISYPAPFPTILEGNVRTASNSLR